MELNAKDKLIVVLLVILAAAAFIGGLRKADNAEPAETVVQETMEEPEEVQWEGSVLYPTEN